VIGTSSRFSTNLDAIVGICCWSQIRCGHSDMTKTRCRLIELVNIAKQTSKGLDILELCHCSGVERYFRGQCSAVVQTRKAAR
jgi:hypothetical protein